MASEPDPDRLRALEARLAQAKKGSDARATPSTAKGLSQGEIAWRMVIELATGIVLGFAIGYGIDALTGTIPVFLVIFTLLGFAAGIRTMLRTAKDMERVQAERSAKDKGT